MMGHDMLPVLDENHLEQDHIREEALAFANIGLYRYTFEGSLLFMDRGAMQLLGLEGRFPTPESLVGQNIEDLIVYVGPRGYLRDNIRKTGHLRNFEYPYQTLDGEERWVLHDSYLVHDRRSDVDAIQVIIRDITARKQAEETLRELKQEAEFYLDLMTHDLTNYNQVLMGNLDLLVQFTTLDPQQRRFVDACQRQVIKSENLVTRVKQLSRLKHLTRDTLRALDLTALVRANIQIVQRLYLEKASRVTFEIEEPRMGLGIDLLDSVILNIIENAIKHAPTSPAEVQVDILSENLGERPCWVVTVQDRGNGVPDEAKERIFTRFTRASKEKGTGLGLSLAKAIMDKIGGRVLCEDRVPGDHTQGSVFKIVVPKI